jgi:hypothetical protein
MYSESLSYGWISSRTSQKAHTKNHFFDNWQKSDIFKREVLIEKSAFGAMKISVMLLIIIVLNFTLVPCGITVASSCFLSSHSQSLARAPLEDTVFFGVCSIFLMLLCWIFPHFHFYITLHYRQSVESRVSVYGKNSMRDAQFLIILHTFTLTQCSL